MRKNWKILKKKLENLSEKLEYFEKNWEIWKKSKNLVRTEREPQTKPENLGQNQKRFLARRKSPEKWGKKYPKVKIQAKMQKKNPRKKIQEK